jgi:mannan endo-1,4-beta-mannosidase
MDRKNNFLNIDKNLSITTHPQGLLADNSTLHTNDYNNLRISSRSSFNISHSNIPDSAGNTLSSARRITIGSSNDTYNDFVGRADRNDYYTFNLSNNSNFSLSLHTKSPSVNFQLLDSKGDRIQSSTSAETPEDSISLHLNTGTYYIRVFSNTSTQNTPYQLDLTATPIAPFTSNTETAYKSVAYKDGFSGRSSVENNQSPMSADTPIKDPLLGVYYGNQGWNMNQVQAMETWQGKKNAVVNMFTDWSSDTTTMNNLFNTQLLNIWNNKNIPMITWEPFTSGSTTPDNIEVLIANGQFDGYINTWADKLKTFLSGADGVYNTGDDRRAYLRLAHEMNGDWYSWSAAKGGNSPTDYVNMWKHTKDIFDAKGMDASRLQWVWSVNNTDVGGFSAEQYYPGDAYVNWVAIDGYNWGTSQSWSSWQTPSQVFDNMIGRLNAMSTRPIAITEVGSSTATSSGTSLTAKSQWMTNMFNYAVNKNIKMVSWFNQDKETDWAAFGGANGDSTYKANKTNYKAYTAYKTGITPASYSGSDTTNPRLLSDTYFAGLMA